MRENIKCPCCASRMTAVTDCGVEIDCCSACQGIWLDSSELSALIVSQQADADLSGIFSGGNTFPAPQWSGEELSCPCCLDPLEDVEFGDGVRVCPSCHGMFFEPNSIPLAERWISNFRARHEGQGSGLAKALVSTLAGIVG